MGKNEHNIIHKANLLFEVPNEKVGRQIYAGANDIFNSYIVPELEKFLSQFTDDEVITIDVLDIDLNFSAKEITSEHKFQSVISKKIESHLQNVLKQKMKQNNEEKAHTFSDEFKKTIDGFVYFLRTGRLPWYFVNGTQLSKVESIIEAINKHEKYFLEKFDQLVQIDRNVVNKIFAQYDILLVNYILSLYVSSQVFSDFTKITKTLRTLFSKHLNVVALNKIEMQWVIRFWTVLLYNNSSVQENVVANFINKTNEFIGYVSNKYDIKTQLKIGDDVIVLLDKYLRAADDVTTEILNEIEKGETKQNKKDNNDKNDNTAYYFDNVGLILLHPFLQYFFMEFSLLNNDNNFIDETARETAVHLLHYLATCKENVPDFDLAFAKYLCGMPFDYITQRQTIITDKMKTEADELLISVIKHWTALKNTTPQGLQESFLQRSGKLIIGNENDKLFIAHNVIDILLNRLPWSISIVKLPWLEKMIYTE